MRCQRLTLPICLAICLSSIVPASGAIPQSERNALIDLFNSTGGENWYDKTGWLCAVGTECSWKGVTCNQAGDTVEQLWIMDKLWGSIPASIDGLPNLKYLNINPVGAGWSTTVSIVNLDAQETPVELRLIGDGGNQIASRTIQIPGQGKVRITDQNFFVDPGAGLVQEYVEIRSSSAKLLGSVVFGDAAHGRFTASLALVAPEMTDLIFGQLASGMIGDKDNFTGLAILNPGVSSATVLIRVQDQDGNKIGETTVTIPAHARISRLLTEFFPHVAGQNLGSGYMRVISTAGSKLAGFALFGSRDALSAVPAQPFP
jgi:hypothetical protein